MSAKDLATLLLLLIVVLVVFHLWFGLDQSINPQPTVASFPIMHPG